MAESRKVLLLVRVSTAQQSFDEQRDDLVKAALKLGYGRVGDDILIVDGKESAIHLKESERETILEMKQYIANVKSIDRLMIWELSRLSRRPADLYSLRDYLQENKIQLTCLKPEFNLFNEVDFTINELANISFSIFSTIAENEMFIKKARFKRSKNRNAELGRFSGGRPKLGYKVDEKGYYVIDENTSSIIKDIYNMYVNQRKSMHIIHDELADNGISMSYTSIRYVLSDSSYCGLKTSFRKDNLERRFPPIISEEEYHKASILRESNRVSTKNTPCNKSFLGLQVITCWDCKHHMSAKPKNCCYFCVTHTYPYQSQSKKKCGNGCSVRADVADSLLWQLGKQEYIKQLKKNSVEEYMLIADRKLDIERKLAHSNENIQIVNHRLELNENAHILGTITENSYQINKCKLHKQVHELKKKAANWEILLDSVIKELTLIEHKNTLSPEDVDVLIRDINSITDTSEMIRIIRQYIKCMYVRYLRPGTKDKVFNIIYNDGREETYLQKSFKTSINRIYLDGERYEIIDESVGFSFQYVKMHPSQKEFYSLKGLQK